VERRVNDPILRAAFLLRALLSLAIVVLMTTKPSLGSSLLVMLAAGVLTAVLSISFRRRVS
jgi:hypothetical protein